MNSLLRRKNSSFLKATPECILANWLSTVTDFGKYYHQLLTYINQTTTEQNLNISKTLYIGQCPINSLVKLTSTMSEELKNLIQNVDQLDNSRPSSISKGHKKLENHTWVLLS